MKTFRFAAIVLTISAVLLWTPTLATASVGVVLHLFVGVIGLFAFAYVGFQVVERSAGIAIALILFAAGLALELCTFAFLFQRDGVLCASSRVDAHGGLVLAYALRYDFGPSLILSIDVWTAGGYGSVMAQHTQASVAAVEMLIGYLYMAMFIAILINVFQQYVHLRRTR
jgi:ABC-type polysaccharide transport system permease subunit